MVNGGAAIFNFQRIKSIKGKRKRKEKKQTHKRTRPYAG